MITISTGMRKGQKTLPSQLSFQNIKKKSFVRKIDLVFAYTRALSARYIYESDKYLIIISYMFVRFHGYAWGTWSQPVFADNSLPTNKTSDMFHCAAYLRRIIHALVKRNSDDVVSSALLFKVLSWKPAPPLRLWGATDYDLHSQPAAELRELGSSWIVKTRYSQSNGWIISLGNLSFGDDEQL